MVEGTKTKRILIIEDEEDMREIYKSMFASRKDEYEVEAVGDARVGFKRIEKEKYDLIILDIIMDPMPGDTFFLCARSDEKLKEVPILVVSVLSPNDMMEQFKKENHVDYLQKPVTEEQLFSKIESLV